MMAGLFSWGKMLTLGGKVGVSAYGVYSLNKEIESFPYIDPWELGEGVALTLGPWKWGRTIMRKSAVPVTRGAAIVAWRASNIVRIGTVSVSIGIGELLGAVVGGYIAGAAVGIGISWLGWGSKGASDAWALYTGQVGAGEYYSTVKRGLQLSW